VKNEVITQDDVNKAVITDLAEALENLRESRPGDHSNQDRAYAILITDLEKALAYAEAYL
jgi:hypothetical protein